MLRAPRLFHVCRCYAAAADISLSMPPLTLFPAIFSHACLSITPPIAAAELLLPRLIEFYAMMLMLFRCAMLDCRATMLMPRCC